MDGVITFVDRGPMEGTRVEGNVFVADTDKIAIDAVGVAILRILGTTPEVTKGPISFIQQYIFSFFNNKSSSIFLSET